jgi:hypothetical protein
MTNQNNCTLPAVPFGSAKISRLIIGGNPFKGNSHCDPELDQAMRDYYTSEQIVQTLQNAEKAGLTAMLMRGDQQIIDIVEKYRQVGGTMQWISQTASEWPDVSENIRVMAGHNPLGIYHHGTDTDKYFKEGKMDIVLKRVELIKSLGLLAGVGSHMPEALEWIEQQGWPVDFYMCSAYNLSREDHESQIVSKKFINEDHLFVDSDRDRMCEFIQSTPKTCLAFKVLAANRHCSTQKHVRNAIRYVLERIKPTDAIIVGVFCRDFDQITANAQYVREEHSKIIRK